MSTLDATATAVVDKIPLGRRIGEIMEEKGDAFSIRAFSARLGMNREILRVIIAGERTILPSELEKIAEGLGMTVARLRQLDTKADEERLESLLKTKQNLKLALILAQDLVQVSKGSTEKCKCLNNLGRAQYLLQQYEPAHETWLLAFPYAEKIQVKSRDSRLLHLVTANLMISYSLRKEYTNMDHVLHTVETVFHDEPEKLSAVHYARMKLKEEQRDYVAAKKYAYLSLECIEYQEMKHKIGKAQINAAHYEFLTKNYDVALHLLEKAIQNLVDDLYSILVAVKDFAKILLQMRRYNSAAQVIEEYLDRSSEYPDLEAQLLCLYSVATKDMSYADRVLDNLKVSRNIRYLASKLLLHHYKTLRDAESLLRYHEKADRISAKAYNFLDEEDLS